MKKFITVSPFQARDSLHKGVYQAVDNSKLNYNKEIAFPILTAIQGYVTAGESIEIICIQADYQNAIDNTEELRTELTELCKTKNITFYLNVISIAYNNMLETHLDTFHKLIENCSDNDELYACVTYGFKPLSIVQIMALNYACKMKNNVKVNCVVYGERDFVSKEMRVYDVTSLYLLDGVIQHLAQANIADPLKHMELLLNSKK